MLNRDEAKKASDRPRLNRRQTVKLTEAQDELLVRSALARDQSVGYFIREAIAKACDADHQADQSDQIRALAYRQESWYLAHSRFLEAASRGQAVDFQQVLLQAESEAPYSYSGYLNRRWIRNEQEKSLDQMEDQLD